jgi:hypothetical protein
MRNTIQALVVAATCLFSSHVVAQGAPGAALAAAVSPQELQRDLETMKSNWKKCSKGSASRRK